MKRTIAAASLLIIGFALSVSLQALAAALPSGTAVFETSLQSRISSTDTSLTLVSNSVRGGTTLSGYQCLTIDEGLSTAEVVCGTLSGTTVSGLTRGIDPQTGTTSNSSLKFAHRVGADVKITDFPLIQILRNQANGSDTYPNPLRYASGVVPSTADDLTDKGYVDGVAFSGAGVIDASTVSKGVVELATQTEAASSTSTGGSGTLAIPASSATSTYNANTAPLRVVVTQNSGKIDDNFIGTSTLFATTSIGGGPIGSVGKNTQVFTSTGTTTFAVPSGVRSFLVEVQGAGGGGGDCSAAVSAAGGGAAGGYSFKLVDLSATTSVQVFVGTGGAHTNAGTWSSFGTNGFYASATGGSAGANGNTSAASLGGTAGTGSGGLINSDGDAGGNASFDVANVNTTTSGKGGASRLGGGAKSASGTANGVSAGNYGGGGSGASCSTSNSQTGGSGSNGIVIVRW